MLKPHVFGVLHQFYESLRFHPIHPLFVAILEPMGFPDREDHVPLRLGRHDHFHEDFLLDVLRSYTAHGDNYVVFSMVPFRKLLRHAQELLGEMLVDSLLLSTAEHLCTAVEAIKVLEALLQHHLTKQTGAASEIHNLAGCWHVELLDGLCH